MRRAASTAALLRILVSLALLGGACAAAENDAGTASANAASAQATAAPVSAPPASDPPLPESPATTPALEEPAPPPETEPPPAPEEPPPATSDASEVAPTTTHAAPQSTEAAEPPPTSVPLDGAPAPKGGATPGAAESLPGEPYEYGPDEGASLAVVGVPYEDVLTVHDAPLGDIVATLDASNPYEGLVVREAPSGEFIVSLDPGTGGIVATGRTRMLPDSEWPDAVWDEIRVARLTGWARAVHLAPTGLTDDLTARIIDVLGERPEAEQLGELALIVGDAFASTEEAARVIIVTKPIVFEALGEVTADVLNIGDDSLLGYRLHIFAVPTAEDWMSEDPGPFILRTVERTILCQSYRCVTTDDLCV